MSNQNTTTKHIKTLLKLGLAGSTILAIGALFLVANPDGEVQDSQADIVDLDVLAPQTSTQKFVAALDDLGHEKPRIYNYNGTEIYFSTRTSPKRPNELIDEYQRAFVDRGVNSKTWGVQLDKELLKDPKKLKVAANERAAASLAGEVQVAYHDEDRVIMNGAVIDVDHLQFHYNQDNEEYAPSNFHNLFKMHRYVEANWNPIKNESTVTATWSDEDFDVTKTMDERFQDPESTLTDNAPDLSIPSCIGCARLTRFATVANDKPYVKQILTAPSTPDDVARFYREAMPRNGWLPMPGKTLDQRIASQNPQFEHTKLLTFQRNGEFVTISIYPDNDTGGSIIDTMTSD